MTILQDECRPTHQTPSDAVVGIIEEALKTTPRDVSFTTAAQLILSALSDAGLEIVLKAGHAKGKPTIQQLEEILEAGEGGKVRIKPDGSVIVQAAAVHPSQPEKTDE